MTAEELRKLSRTDLMEVLVAQMKENEILQKQVEKAKKLLSEREITLRESGTMAEAAMKLCGVFEAADAATKLYRENLENAFSRSRDIIREAEEKAAQIISDAEKKAAQMIFDAEAASIDLSEEDASDET